MGWFSSFRNKFIDPVVDAVVETVIDPVVEAVTAVVDTVYSAVVEPVVSALSSAASTVVDFISDGATALASTVIDAFIEYAPAVAFEGLTYFIDTFYSPSDIDVAAFEPVVDEDEQVQHETITSDAWTDEETVMVRDAIALSEVGFADFSDLYDDGSGAVDANGYVIDDAAFYAFCDWNEGIESWVENRFDVIRVQETTVELVYEANVTLLQCYDTSEYFITIGGTDSLEDAITDVALTFFGTTFSQYAISDIISDFFTNDIEDGADVNLVGSSLGGAEALLQYQASPDLFDEVFVVASAGLGGFEGTYYDRNMWDGMGDPNITEINGDDDGVDFNDLVTSLGHVGAGQTYFIEEVIQAEGNSDNEFIDAHMNDNLWASLPGGEFPDLPIADTSADVFDFV